MGLKCILIQCSVWRSVGALQGSVTALLHSAPVLTLDRQGFIFEEGFRRRAGRVHKQLLKRAETNSLQQGHLRWERLHYF